MRRLFRGVVIACLLGSSHVLAAAPRSEAWFAAGAVALRSEDYQEARQALERAIVADPKNARAYAYLGQVHQQLGALHEARKYYRIALEIDPDQVEGLSWAGQSDVALGQIDQAQEKLERLRRLCGPGCAEYRALERSLAAHRTRQNDRSGSR